MRMVYENPQLLCSECFDLLSQVEVFAHTSEISKAGRVRFSCRNPSCSQKDLAAWVPLKRVYLDVEVK